ncbi:IS5 family transposase [Prosthecochloris sp. SCSIO W1101]|nr:IS5 family transposase [Prosthecochloris sp. SCSIO W1101]UZJ41963.1 IS5 family transposase [Prosthecochloris sp. SCSIO W1101]UZJ41967.1 IS5 family transposase [Prosthecochloris sp. SCSIO W1101]
MSADHRLIGYDVQDHDPPESLQSLSDDQMEYQITDRLSFKRFLGLKSSDRVPDSKTIWKFRETLIQEEVIEALFYRFNQALDDQSIFAKTGQIVDASFVEVPKQRNSRGENQQIKKGQTPEAWKAKPNKLHQKDRDARWAKKNKMNFYGYKNHIKVDYGTKLIGAYAVSDAATHDSRELETLIDKDDASQKLYADNAYIGQEESIEWCGMQSEVHEKSTRTKKLTKSQQASNKRKPKYRAREKHVFGFLTIPYHARNGYPHYRHYQSSCKNCSVKPDLQYDALCAAQKACAQCFSGRISTFFRSISEGFSTHKVSKKRVFRINNDPPGIIRYY